MASSSDGGNSGIVPSSYDGYSPGQGGDGANDGRVGDDDPDIEVFNNNYLSFFSGLTTSPACSNGMSLYSLNVII